MGLETANNIGELNPAWPLGSDPKAEGNDHIQLIKSVLQASWPIGKIWQSTIDENPFIALGFGTWVQLAPGRVLVGSGDSGDGNDLQGGDQGGASTHQLTEAQMPNHTHGLAQNSNTETGGSALRISSGAGVEPTGPAGSDQPHNNMQPYQVVFQWERTA